MPEDRDSLNVTEVLLAVAQDAKERGDVGEPGFITVEAFLESWAKRFQMDGDLAFESVVDLLDRKGYPWRM